MWTRGGRLYVIVANRFTSRRNLHNGWIVGAHDGFDGEAINIGCSIGERKETRLINLDLTVDNDGAGVSRFVPEKNRIAFFVAVLCGILLAECDVQDIIRREFTVSDAIVRPRGVEITGHEADEAHIMSPSD